MVNFVIGTAYLREKNDFSLVKEKLKDVFGQRQHKATFQAFINARPRYPGEAIQVYAAELTRPVADAFPDYDERAQQCKIFRRFLACLDVALVQKCHEHGVTNLQEALRISMQAERAIEASRMHGSTPTMVIPPYPSTLPGAQPLVATLNADVPDQTKILVQSVTSLTEQVSNLCLKVGEFISSSKDSQSESAYDQNYRAPPPFTP